MSGACASCGMFLGKPSAYHPWTACELMKRLRNGDQVEGNLRAVVAYGMEAQKAGVSLDHAMNDIRWRSATEGAAGPAKENPS